MKLYNIFVRDVGTVALVPRELVLSALDFVFSVYPNSDVRMEVIER